MAVVSASGELDLASVPKLRRTLGRVLLGQEPVVILDLRDLEFLDTAGLHLILRASEETERAGSEFVVIRGPREVDKVLTLTQPIHSFDVVDLEPAKPPVAALLGLARFETAA